MKSNLVEPTTPKASHRSPDDVPILYCGTMPKDHQTTTCNNLLGKVKWNLFIAHKMHW
jgi:hypothetical protein